MNANRARTRHLNPGGREARQPRDAATAERVIAAITALLDAAGVEPELRAEVLGGAFVTEAVRPYWGSGRSAEEAHALLRHADSEMADAVEAVSPMLLGRAQARRDASETIRAIESMLGQFEQQH
jgi:hypothetical protein